MSEQEERNTSDEVSGTISEGPRSTTKKKKKKKVQQSEDGDDLIAGFGNKNSQEQSKKPKKKKKKSAKMQSDRPQTSSVDAREVGTPTKKKKKKPKIDDDMDQDSDVYDYGMDENGTNNNNIVRRHEARPHDITHGKGNVYSRNNYEEEQRFPYSGSTADDHMLPSKMYNHRGSNNGQLAPMYLESHHDNGFVEYDDGDYMSEMGNRDPIDGYDQDMSEDEEEETRFKYSTADLDNGDCRNSKCCLIVAGVFFVIIAIVVSIYMGRLMKRDRRQLLTSIHNLRGAL